MSKQARYFLVVYDSFGVRTIWGCTGRSECPSVLSARPLSGLDELFVLARCFWQRKPVKNFCLTPILPLNYTSRLIPLCSLTLCYV